MERFDSATCPAVPSFLAALFRAPLRGIENTNRLCRATCFRWQPLLKSDSLGKGKRDVKRKKPPAGDAQATPGLVEGNSREFTAGQLLGC